MSKPNQEARKGARNFTGWAIKPAAAKLLNWITPIVG